MSNVIDLIFNPEYFSGLATIFTGIIAWFVYINQKRDEKTKAAIIIMTEIRNAENSLDIIQDKLHTGATSDFPSILSTNNWKVFGHLFAKDFDQDELQIITKFYDICGVMDDLCTRNNNFFWISAEERARVMQHLLADIAKEHYQETDFPNHKDVIVRKFHDHIETYAPQKTLNGIEYHIGNIQRITPTEVWNKLKIIAKLKK